MELSLVNLSPAHARTVIIQAGCFGEHQFTRLWSEGAETAIDDRYVQVVLKPGTQIDLSLGMRRFCNGPTFAQPWHGDGIPFR